MMKLFDRKRKTFAIFASMVLLALLASACGSANTGSSSSTTTTSGNNGKGCKKVGVLLPETATSARWDSKDRPLLIQGIKNALPGATVDYNNAEGSATEQQNQANADLTKGDCILVLAPFNAQTAAAIVTKAKLQGVPVKFFLFARDGYPPYGTTMVSTRGFVDKNPDATARFVKASLEGWKSYLTDPTPGNALIKADNPKMSDAQIAFGVEQLKLLKVIDGGDAAKLGIGIITEPRWQATYDFMVSAGLLKPEVDWKAGFTDRFVKNLKLSM